MKSSWLANCGFDIMVILASSLSSMGMKYSLVDNICIFCFFLTSAKSLGGAPTLRVKS